MERVHSIHWNFCTIVETATFGDEVKGKSYQSINRMNKAVEILSHGFVLPETPDFDIIHNLRQCQAIIDIIGRFVKAHFITDYFGIDASNIQKAYLDDIKEINLSFEFINDTNDKWLANPDRDI